MTDEPLSTCAECGFLIYKTRLCATCALLKRRQEKE